MGELFWGNFFLEELFGQLVLGNFLRNFELSGNGSWFLWTPCLLGNREYSPNCIRNQHQDAQKKISYGNYMDATGMIVTQNVIPDRLVENAKLKMVYQGSKVVENVKSGSYSKMPSRDMRV